MNNLVSVVVTSYNHAEYLRQRMDSLLRQTHDALQIVVVDDCSTDGSMEVLKAYEGFPRIQIVGLDKNIGYAGACNLGVSLCEGEFIMFAECDDFNEPDHVKILLERLMANEGVGVAFCRSNVVDDQGALLGDDFQVRDKRFKKLCFKDTLIEKGVMQEFLLSACVIPNMSAALIRKPYFERAGGLSSLYKASADWDFWCRISELCDFYYVSRPLNNFRTHPTTVRSTFGLRLQMVEMFDFLYGFARRLDLKGARRFRFKLGTAVIWGGRFRGNGLNWLKSFPYIWMDSLKYDKLSILYLFLAAAAKALAILRPFGRKQNGPCATSL